MGEEFLGILLGAALLASTMRRSNGYRGLHEILSGTATIWLPAPPPRSILPQILLNSAVPQEARPLAEPLVMGNFTLSHELWQNESGAVYAGRDEKLARPVWLWLHADGIPNLEQARRTVSRPTRWRWLACGAYAGKSWDAFLATPGISLTTLLSQGHKLDWPATYHLLVELCEEMRAARQDNTTVPIMAPQQVWIQQRGCVQLLDVPKQPFLGNVETPSEADELHFLGVVSRMALEGHPEQSSNTLQRAIPATGYALINRLLKQPVAVTSLEALEEELHELAERPFVLKRLARLRSLAFQLAWLAPAGLAAFAFTSLLAMIVQYVHGVTYEWSDVMEILKRLRPYLLPI
ncbi:MAG TPA: hypothetical protein PKD72_16730, partial [Gemmatales bacterium]|nr:hypothetical protein [Gemmatales bacterium]